MQHLGHAYNKKSIYVSLLPKLTLLKFTEFIKLANGFSFLCRASCVLYHGKVICGEIKAKIQETLKGKQELSAAEKLGR